ncbi:UDP-N-acetylmuramoyl-tripeptide--D-alanyl-D-alanine ligase [Clostridium grantii]|uniref:UDP-N-acetylmuramoyl-tripeptide--D-alanyl-D-alanine ligase n=1 Tax=Clostridium grantii DSM 8605 TaxID=1121316 RepID=A0A1M5SHX6_9CLOT|nr:UDP-N-acetylmuramoyl-tripeptide--D-alanyl-D-alanine ligase [Clostridium grantii]SHH38065.1 UDP-N-acetylmuramoyl-tripeptide--D-alanyl-D-alanine ligase [Clostridium grantii DSM 8605]
METLLFHEIVKAIDGEILKKTTKEQFDSVIIDSRKITEGCIFLALKGDNFDANEFVIDSSKKGAKLCIIDNLCFSLKEVAENTSIILVKDSKKALLDLAEYYRTKLNIKVIGITGSTGKTSTKDILAAMLSEKFKVFKTKGNFNNEIGLPLMIFQLNDSYDVAVLEMGMSGFGEINNLARVARPDLAIITNIGVSHIEHLKTRENILKAKLEIVNYFSEKSSLIVNGENDLLSTLSSNKFDLFKIGLDRNKNTFATDIEILPASSKFKVVTFNGTHEFNLNMPGEHNILNTLLCIECCELLGMSFEEMEKGLNNIERTSMRLDIVKGDKFTIIDDCYNASPDSTKAAIEVLASFKDKRKVAILGTMKELGEEAYKHHESVGKHLKKNNIDILVSCGEYGKAYFGGFEKENNSFLFANIEEMASNISFLLKKDDVLLVKASRSEKFENIVNLLKSLDIKGE